MDSAHEDRVLSGAALILDAVALSEAVLVGDIEEARFRASLIVCCPCVTSRPPLFRAAQRVVVMLGESGPTLFPGCAAAIHALSLEIDRLGIGSEP